jgi:hypothetical protein
VILVAWALRQSNKERTFKRHKPQSLSRIKGAIRTGCKKMDLITIIEYLQGLIVLGIFLMILGAGFKVWKWNYVVPPR